MYHRKEAKAGSDVRSKFPTSLDLPEKEEVKSRSNVPIAGFVSTSILKSSDGLFGDNTEEERIATTDGATGSAKISDSRPLYDRLKEQKNARDEVWKEQHNFYGTFAVKSCCS